MTFGEIGTIVLPVFGLIGLGLAAARVRLFEASVGEALGEFVFLVPIPILMFRTIATAHFPDQSPWPLWLAYFAGVILIWSLGALAGRFLFGMSHAESVIAGVSASFSNLLMIGIPLILTAYGEAGVVVLFMLISIHLPIMMVSGTILIERAVRRDTGQGGRMAFGALLRRIGTNLVTNPIVIAIVAGGLWRATGLPMTGVPRVIVDQMAAAATPCALFAMGMGLSRHGMSGRLSAAGLIALLKLLAMPAAVFAAARYAGLPPLWVNVATISAASPSGVNAYLFATRFKVGHGTASNAISLTNLLAVATIAFWLDLVGRF